MQLCVEYMLKHISKAATQGVLVSWLHYTISFSPYHQEITDAIQRFLKWNLDIMANARDFVDLDINILIALLQQNDLVLKNEYELFTYAENWFSMKKRQMDVEQTTSSITDEQKAFNERNLREILRSIFIHIRYPMMVPHDLASILLKKPLIKQDADFFFERHSIGMAYHAGQMEFSQKVQQTVDGTGMLQYTPRLYTSESLSMEVPEFFTVGSYQKFGGCFFSRRNLSEHEELKNSDGKLGRYEKPNNMFHSINIIKFFPEGYHWDIDFYPRGIRYGKAQIINVYNGSLEIPEVLLRTVRLSVSCKSDLETDQRFMVGTLTAAAAC